MKKIVVILGLCLFCCGQVQAEEKANQAITSEDNKAVILLQKQPTDTKSTQTQDVKRNWFCIVIQVNGKAKENTDTVR